MDASSTGAATQDTNSEWYTVLQSVLKGALTALEESGGDKIETSQFSYSFSSIMLLLAIYSFEIMQVPITEEECRSLVTTLGDYKEEARTKLYQIGAPGSTPPSNWEPSVLLESDSLFQNGIIQNESYYSLSVPDQLLWARLMALIAMGFRRNFEAIFKQHRFAVCSVLLHASFFTWSGAIAENTTTSNLTPLIAYYDHIRGFLQAPSFSFSATTSQSYPSPIVENASRTPQALLYVLDAYHRLGGDVLNATNIETCLEPLKCALVYICRHRLPSQSHVSNSREQIESKETVDIVQKRFGSVQVSDAVNSLFESLVNACKTSKSPTRKRHAFIEWEEMEMIFKFGWIWKTYPMPRSIQRMSNPHEIFGKLFIQWASELKPSHRLDTALRLYKMMQKMTKEAADPEASARRLASACLPEFSFLLPSLQPHLSPHASIFLLTPEIAQHSAALKRTILDYLPSKIASDSSLHNAYNKFKQNQPKRFTPQNPNAMDVDSNHTSTPIDTTPFSTPHEFAQWCKLRLKTQKSKFNDFARELARLYDPYPMALETAMNSAAIYAIDSLPNLLSIMRSAFSWIRVEDTTDPPYAEHEGAIISKVPK